MTHNLPVFVLTLFALCIASAEPTPRKPAGQSDPRITDYVSIDTEFRSLQRARAAALRSTGKDRVRHIEALKALYDRAKKLPESYELPIHINTELEVFGAAVSGEHRWRNNDSETVSPIALVDPETRITYYLETDGRHIAAIAPNGKIVWYRDPFTDTKLEPYRVSKPVIRVFEFMTTTKAELEARAINRRPPAKHDRDKKIQTIRIEFNSSQFGQIELETGDFTWEGQN